MPFSIISSAPVSSLCHSLPMTFDLFRTSPYHPLHHSFPIPTLTSLSQPFPHLSTPPNSLSTTSSLLPLPHHLTLHYFILLPPPHDLTLHHCHFFPLLSPSQFLLPPRKGYMTLLPCQPLPPLRHLTLHSLSPHNSFCPQRRIQWQGSSTKTYTGSSKAETLSFVSIVLGVCTSIFQS